MRTTMLALLAALPLALAACGDDASIPPTAPPEPAAAVAPAALTEPLEAEPGTAVHAFSVPTIHCDSCADTIRANVGKVAGVRDVSVSVPAHTVWVRVQESGPTADALARAITDAGYDATPASTPHAGAAEAAGVAASTAAP